jgi:hypothetical protein
MTGPGSTLYLHAILDPAIGELEPRRPTAQTFSYRLEVAARFALKGALFTIMPLSVPVN